MTRQSQKTAMMLAQPEPLEDNLSEVTQDTAVSATDRLPDATNARPRPLALESMGSVLQRVRALLNLDNVAEQSALKHVWATALPANLHRYCQVRRVEGPTHEATLVVACRHGMVANQLQLMAPKLLASLNAYSAQTGITLVAIRPIVDQRL